MQNGALVGTEQRSIEPVTGHLARQVIASAGAVCVLWIALFVGIAFGLFRDRNQLDLLLTTPLLGTVLGLAWSRLGHSTATRGGTRNLVAVNHILATTYDVLAEPMHAARAHDLHAPLPREATV